MVEVDQNFTVPDGFEPVLVYPGGKEPGVPVPNRVKHAGMTFWIGHGIIPKLPLKSCGEFMHVGWDIPTHWAIDSDDVCWMDNAHGHPLQPVPAGVLLRSCESEHIRSDLRKILGMEPETPEWECTARSLGWVPPVGVPDLLLKRVAEVESELVRLRERDEEHTARIGEFLRLAAKHGWEYQREVHAALIGAHGRFRTELDSLRESYRALRRKLNSREFDVATLRAKVEELTKDNEVLRGKE